MPAGIGQEFNRFPCGNTYLSSTTTATTGSTQFFVYIMPAPTVFYLKSPAEINS